MEKASSLVVLLLDDIGEAQKLSHVFRQVGVIPSFFRELKTFWYSILKERPMLAIVDVKKMSEGQYLLKDHPLIVSQSLPLAFYYPKNSRPLLTSTHEFFHYGLLEESDSYERPLKVILERVYRNERMKQNVVRLQEKLKYSQTKYIELRDNTFKEDRPEDAMALLYSLSKKFNEISSMDKFLDVVSDTLSQGPEVQEFCFTMLGPSQTELRSPDLFGCKYKKMPVLKVGQRLQEGIEFFAQNMAIEVALDLLGDHFIPIHLFGENKNPDCLLFLKIAERERKTFPWKMLEVILNGLYLRIKRLSSFQDAGIVEHHLNPWTIFSYLDKVNHNKILYQCDFTVLMDYVVSHPEMKFYFEPFFKDFISLFQLDMDDKFDFVMMSLWQIIFIVDRGNEGDFSNKFKEFIDQFQYGCYFSGLDKKEIRFRPELWKLPLSSSEYLKTII